MRSYPVSPILIVVLFLTAFEALYARESWVYLGMLVLGGIHHLYNVWRIDRDEEAEFMRKHTIQD